MRLSEAPTATAFHCSQLVWVVSDSPGWTSPDSSHPSILSSGFSPLRLSWHWPRWRLITTKEPQLSFRRGPCFQRILAQLLLQPVQKRPQESDRGQGTEERGVSASCRKHPTESLLLLPSFYTASLGRLSEIMSEDGSWSQNKA